jgi:hypothetical protein
MTPTEESSDSPVQPIALASSFQFSGFDERSDATQAARAIGTNAASARIDSPNNVGHSPTHADQPPRLPES